MKKLLYKSTILIFIITCILMISSCGTENAVQSPQKIDNLQRYLPNIQGKTIVFQHDGETDHDVFQYTYIDENQINWIETYHINGKVSNIKEGYDYYNPQTKEMSKTITSNTASEYGSEIYLIGEFDKEFLSNDGYTCKITGDSGTVTTVVGTFNNCLVVEVQLDEETIETKYYAPDLGYIYSEIVSNGNILYKEYIISYTPSEYHSDTSTNLDDYEGLGEEVEEYEDNLYRWYLTKKTFENTNNNHTLNIEVAGDTLRFTVDGQFIGTANLDETDYFPDYNGYTTYDTNGEFTVRYYPEKQNIRIIDKTAGNTDYSGIYEYKDK